MDSCFVSPRLANYSKSKLSIFRPGRSHLFLAQMYTAYCAVCHGTNAKGNGPAAEALKVPPPDLTALARKNGGKYPSDHVRSAIEGDVRLLARGPKEMPVWGDLFWRMSQGHSSEVQLRVSNLNKYIESLQAK